MAYGGMGRRDQSAPLTRSSGHADNAGHKGSWSSYDGLDDLIASAAESAAASGAAACGAWSSCHGCHSCRLRIRSVVAPLRFICHAATALQIDLKSS